MKLSLPGVGLDQMSMCWDNVWMLLKMASIPHSAGTLQAPEMEIVALALLDADARIVSRICGSHGWRAHFVDSCAEAWTRLTKIRAPVVLCDRRLEAADWRDVVQMMALSPHRPSVILLSDVVDDYLVAEVIRNGGYDVLATPLHEAPSARMIGLARSYQLFGAPASVLPLKHYR